jgi:type III secretion protein Q
MKAVAPIRDGGLPRVSAADARAARLVQAMAGRLPARADVALGSLGRVEVTLVGPIARDGARPQAVSFGIGRPLIQGRLSIDERVARRAIGEVLREAGVAGPLDVDMLLGPLGFRERGLLAGLVARVFDALGTPLTLSLDAPPRAERIGAEALVVSLEIAAAGSRGWAELEVPARWLEGFARAPLGAAAVGTLPIDARLELARTFLDATELAGLDVGDAVVFDGWPSLERDGNSWPVSLVVGDAAAAAALSSDGRVEIDSSFGARAVDRAEEGTVSSDAGAEKELGEGLDEETARIDVTAMLAAAPVEVIAEVGRVVLRGDEALGLGRGSVLTLGGPRTAEVTLRVGDQLWAEGELVDVEGALGVRVTRVLRPPP